MSPARLSPRKGVSQYRSYLYMYGLRAGSVIIVEGCSALDTGAALQPESAAKGACKVKPCRSRRLLRLLRNTSRPIVHVAVLPDRSHSRLESDQVAMNLSSANPPVQQPQIKMPACRADCVHVAEGRTCA